MAAQSGASSGYTLTAVVAFGGKDRINADLLAFIKGEEIV